MGEDRNPHPPGIPEGGSERGPAGTARPGVQRLPRGAGLWLRACPAFPGNGGGRLNVPNPAAWVTSSSPWRRRVGRRPPPPLRLPRPAPGAGSGLRAFGLRSRPISSPAHSGQEERRSLGVGGRCGGRCAGLRARPRREAATLLGARCRRRAHRPPARPLGCHLQSLGPAPKSLRLSPQRCLPLTTQAKVTAIPLLVD